MTRPSLPSTSFAGLGDHRVLAPAGYPQEAGRGDRRVLPPRAVIRGEPGRARRVPRHLVGEDVQDRRRAAGDLQPAEDVLQVSAHGSLGQAEAPGDLGIGVPVRDQPQQLHLPRSKPGPGARLAAGAALLAAALAVLTDRAWTARRNTVVSAA
jgi:hypothetical protein